MRPSEKQNGSLLNNKLTQVFCTIKKDDPVGSFFFDQDVRLNRLVSKLSFTGTFSEHLFKTLLWQIIIS